MFGCDSLDCCSFGVCDGRSAVNDFTFSSSLPWHEPGPAPNTDMKDGNETGTDGGEFAGACMLDGDIDIDLRFDGTVRGGGGRPDSSAGWANMDMQ